MRRCGRILALALLAAIVTASMPCAPASAEQSLADIPDLTDEQASELVRKAFEKYRSHKVIGYVLESWDAHVFYAYDAVNDIGVVSPTVDPEAMPIRESGPEFKLNDWYDFKNKLLYETYHNDNNPKDIKSSYTPIDKDECDIYKQIYFDEFIRVKEKPFPEASNYYYAGKTWEYGPNHEAHVCYRIGVPDSDESLYLDEEDYLPEIIYVGVEDGEVYRIDEERYVTNRMSTSITSYYTHFCFPDEIRIPDHIIKESKLDYEYCPSYKSVDYFQVNSAYNKKKKGLVALQLSADAENVTTINIPDQITIRNIKYRVEEVGNNAFSDENTVKKAVIGNYVHKIKGEAFYRCKNLKKVTIGKRIKSIARDAFSHCHKLKTIIIKNKKMRRYVNSKKGRKKLGIRKQVIVK